MTVLAPLLVVACASPAVTDKCAYDKKAMLALDEQAFDQDLANGGGGWRRLGNVAGCELVAADLLADYRAAHPSANKILVWHEGQSRAFAHQYDRAIPLLDSDRKSRDKDEIGWNYYVDATVAFLKGDKDGLLRARERLAAVPYPDDSEMPPLKNGYMEIPAEAGRPAMKIPWPPNIDVVDGLIKCFGKPYAEAYGGACRPTGN